jgi:hypothetical protein
MEGYSPWLTGVQGQEAPIVPLELNPVGNDTSIK